MPWSWVFCSGCGRSGFLVGVPIGGVMADRGGRRSVLFLASVSAAAGNLLTVMFFGSDQPIAMGLVILGVTVSGVGQGASRPVYQAIVPSVVARHDFQTANAALSLSTRSTHLVGPAFAVIIAAALGLQAAFVVTVLLWLISAVVPPWPAERGDRERGPVRRKDWPRRFAVEVVEGFREARRHPWFMATIGALATVNAAGYSVTSVLTPQISRTNFGDASLLVWTATAYGAGAIAGAIVIVFWSPSRRGWCALAGLGTYCAVPLSLLLAGTFWVPVAVYLVAGIGAEFLNVIWFTAVQQEIPDEKLARVSSVDFIVSYGLAPLGLLAIAPLVFWLGMAPVLVAASTVCLLAILAAGAVPTSSDFRSGR
ncbi:MAG: MFS transporter [Roseovarius sp.]